FRTAPDDLRVVAAHAPAGVGFVLVISGFGGPLLHHIRRRDASARNLVEIFAIGRLVPVVELSVRGQRIGPLLGKAGQALGPDQVADAYAPTHFIMGRQYAVRETCGFSGRARIADLPPLRRQDSGGQYDELYHAPHTSIDARR